MNIQTLTQFPPVPLVVGVLEYRGECVREPQYSRKLGNPPSTPEPTKAFMIRNHSRTCVQLTRALGLQGLQPFRGDRMQYTTQAKHSSLNAIHHEPHKTDP